MVETLTTQLASDLAAVSSRSKAVFEAGGLVAFPTETVYGVAALANSSEGIGQLRDLVGQATKPFTLHLASPEAVMDYLDPEDRSAARLVRKLMPGPVTLMARVDEARLGATSTPVKVVAGEKSEAGEGGHWVGLRCPDHPAATAVLGAVEEPVVAAAAIGGDGRPSQSAEAVEAGLGDRVQLVVDGGRTRFGKSSTVVRLHPRDHAGPGPRLEVTREGVLDQRMVDKAMRMTVLLVCTGNTCRSPMAEGLTAKLMAKLRGVDAGDLDKHGVRVLSAGVTASPGMPVSAGAVSAASKLGVDIASHRSRPLTLDLVNDADVIYTMTAAHREMVLAMAPHARSKVHRLDPDDDVSDPIGRDDSFYDATARQIEQALERRAEELK